jgi:hypothetical protein
MLSTNQLWQSCLTAWTLTDCENFQSQLAVVWVGSSDVLLNVGWKVRMQSGCEVAQQPIYA